MDGECGRATPIAEAVAAPGERSGDIGDAEDGDKAGECREAGAWCSMCCEGGGAADG